MKRTLAIAVAAAAVGLGGSFDLAAQSQPTPANKDSLADHGRYLVKIAGCNDCHTPGYMANAAKVDEKIWLTGDRLGWSGPWGTTYAVNLRLYMKDMTEAEWLDTARNMKARPPMPWFTFEAMSDRDLRAIYQYVKTLGPAGEPRRRTCRPAPRLRAPSCGSSELGRRLDELHRPRDAQSEAAAAGLLDAQERRALGEPALQQHEPRLEVVADVGQADAPDRAAARGCVNSVRPLAT